MASRTSQASVSLRLVALAPARRSLTSSAVCFVLASTPISAVSSSRLPCATFYHGCDVHRQRLLVAAQSHTASAVLSCVHHVLAGSTTLGGDMCVAQKRSCFLLVPESSTSGIVDRPPAEQFCACRPLPPPAAAAAAPPAHASPALTQQTTETRADGRACSCRLLPASYGGGFGSRPA